VSAAATAAAQPSSQDLAYLEFAARANLTEVAQGKLAKRLGATESVRDFGRHMVRDHRRQYRALEAVAAPLGVRLPGRPSAEQRLITKSWARLGSRAFTCAYVPFQWGDHQLVIAVTTHEAVVGTDPTVKQAAAASLPVLTEHLEHATALLRTLRRC
jgi:putative membrane protein